MNRRIRTALTLAACATLYGTTWGQVPYNWNNAAGGSFHTAGNWTPAGPLGINDGAIFNIAGNYTVTFANNNGQSGWFDVSRGTVTFTAAVATADHRWGFSLAGQQDNYVQGGATLILTNMPDVMAGEYLIVGRGGLGTGNMRIINASWLSTNTASVGSFENGSLEISTTSAAQNSRLTTDILNVGYAKISATVPAQGNLLVSGANARLFATTATLGRFDGRANVTVSQGGLAEFGYAIIGEQSGHSTVLVSGANSRLVATVITVGASAEANAVSSIGSWLNIESGGMVEVADELNIATAPVQITGTPLLCGVNVTGTNSLLTVGTRLWIDRGLRGEVNVTNGGRMEIGGSLLMGNSLNGEGDLNILNGGAVEIDSGLSMGSSGRGRINLQNNSSLITNSTSSLSTLSPSGNALVSINSGSVWTANGAINMGSRGQATLMVDGAGSQVISNGISIGVPSTSGTGQEIGTIQIRNRGSLTNTSYFSIGGTNVDHSVLVETNGLLRTDTLTLGLGPINGRGRLEVNSGGQVFSNGASIGSEAGTTGTATINGTTSLWTGTGTNSFDIGQFGTGVVTLTHGGRLQATNGTLGTNTTGIGTLNLTGLASSASFSNSLAVGGTSTAGGGTGTINLNDTASLSVGGQLSLWSGGSINLNGGTLTTASIAFNGGNWNWNEGTVHYSQPTTLNNTLLNSLVGTAHAISQNRNLGSTTGTNLTLASNLTVDGGRLNSGGALNINAGTILMVNNGGEASSSGVVTNIGTILMNGPTSTMSGNIIDNRGSIRGSGVINNTLSNNTTGQVRVAASDWLTFNGTGHTNLGSVQLLGGVLEFANNLNTGTQGFISGHGTLLTSSGAQGGLGLVNTGTFAFSGGNTNIYGDVQNNTTGRIVTSGGSVTTFHDDVLHNGIEIRTSAGSTSVFFGNVSGAGAFTGAGLVQFEGDLRPGNSPANVPFAGDVEFSVTARLVTELGGLVPGSEYDRLTVQGQVILNGLLDVQFINGFMPSAGDVFTIIDNQGSNPVLGTFAGLGEGSSFVSGGQLWEITYQGGTGNDVMLMAVPEPTTWALIVMTAIGGGVVYWRRQRQSDNSLSDNL